MFDADHFIFAVSNLKLIALDGNKKRKCICIATIEESRKKKSLEIFKFAYFIFCDYRILILNAFSIILSKSPDFNA